MHDGQPIRIISSILPLHEINSQYTSPWHPNHIASLRHADMDALIEAYGQIRADNPTSDVAFVRGDEVTAETFAAHVVILGGGDDVRGDDPRGARPYSEALAYYRRRLDLPVFVETVDGGDPEYDRQYVVTSNDAGEFDYHGRRREAHPPRFLLDGLTGEHRRSLDGHPMLEYDVALIARLPNEMNLTTTVTICSGIFSRGTYGAVRAFTDPQLRVQNEELLAKVDLSSLRTIGSGSAPLAPAMVQGFQERLDLPVINIFGSNEGMSLITAPDVVPDPVERASYFPNGLDLTPYYGNSPRRILESRLVPPNGGAVIEDEGVAGELQIRGPTVFEGYWKSPEQTAAAFTDDGWFKTGDMGSWDADFYVTISGRSKDLVITGGLNVYPKEIEELIDAMPGVVESAVIGLPHPDFGEAVSAVVVRQENPAGKALTESGIIAAIKDRLANFKVPKWVYLVDELPRNAMGKVQKNILRQEYSAQKPR